MVAVDGSTKQYGSKLQNNMAKRSIKYWHIIQTNNLQTRSQSTFAFSV